LIAELKIQSIFLKPGHILPGMEMVEEEHLAIAKAKRLFSLVFTPLLFMRHATQF
jgi:hypothetical protein